MALNKELVVRIDVPDDFNDIRHIKHLLMDALYEFSARRYPEEEYMAKRYPDGYLGDHNRDAGKLADIRERNRLARLMHSGIFSISIE